MYSFRAKNNITFMAVVRNLHRSTDINNLKWRLSNMRHKTRKIPLNPFLVELERGNSNSKNFKLEFLNRRKIIAETKHREKKYRNA